jgi:hypothetical protein
MNIQKITLIIIILNAIIFCLFGIKWLIDPIGMSLPLGINLTNPDAITDAQAVYGGLELGFGIFLIYCTIKEQLRFAGILAATLTLMGLGFSRLIGIITVSGTITKVTTELLVTDFFGIIVNTIVLFFYFRSSSKI